MNKLMRMCLGLLGYSLIFLIIIWLIGMWRGDTGVVFVWLYLIWFIVTLFLASWFGLLLRDNPSLVNILKFYLLSAVLGVLLVTVFFIFIIWGAKGIQAIPAEYQQLRQDLADGMPFRGIVLLALFLGLPALIMTASALDGPETPSKEEPHDLKQ